MDQSNLNFCHENLYWITGTIYCQLKPWLILSMLSSRYSAVLPTLPRRRSLKSWAHWLSKVLAQGTNESHQKGWILSNLLEKEIQEGVWRRLKIEMFEKPAKMFTTSVVHDTPLVVVCFIDSTHLQTPLQRSQCREMQHDVSACTNRLLNWRLRMKVWHISSKRGGELFSLTGDETASNGDNGN